MEQTPAGLTRRAALLALAGVGLAACARVPGAPGAPASGTPNPPTSGAPLTDSTPTPAQPSAPPSASPAEMAARATVPVLCYHQVRAWAASDSAYARETLICPPENFREQLDALASAGYTTIGPDAYLAHLRGAGVLPDRPVLLSFDDGKDNQPETAFAELGRRGMTGTLYVMTVVLGKKGWISRAQVRELADAGHTIGSHTYDHQRTPDLATPEEWDTQYVKSRATLQDLSGQPVESFAYPYGLWTPAVVPHLVDAGYTTAFQLTEKPVDPALPAHSLRRRLAASRWSGERLLEVLASFA